MKAARYGSFRISFLMLLFSFMTAACSMDTDSGITQKRVELVPGSHHQKVAASEMKASGLRALADHYAHYGSGPMKVDILYDPASSTNTAMRAADEAVRIASGLRKGGVGEVQTDLVPVTGMGDAAEISVSYDTVTARPPQDCGTMAGIDGNQTGTDMDYSYGCSIESMLARQIARPADLAGRRGLDDGDGRRQSNIVEVYKTGVPNEPLEGESASE